VASPLILAYVILILVAIAHTFVKGPRALVRESGMTWITGGLLVAIVGTILTPAFPVNLPGWTDAILILAIPLSMALAVRRQARLDWPDRDLRIRSPV
jgi:hypothetical protein